MSSSTSPFAWKAFITHSFLHLSFRIYDDDDDNNNKYKNNRLLGFNGTVLHFPFKKEMNAAECLALPWQIKKKKSYFSEQSLFSRYIKINNSQILAPKSPLPNVN